MHPSCPESRCSQPVLTPLKHWRPLFQKGASPFLKIIALQADIAQTPDRLGMLRKVLKTLDQGKQLLRMLHGQRSVLGNLSRHVVRRFPVKNLPFQDGGPGSIKMSYLGNAGSRFNRASTACIAAFPSEMPLSYTLRLSSTTG